MQVSLRAVVNTDLDAIFEQMKDPDSLRDFLAATTERPLFTRAASDNAASLRVLEKAGFRRTSVNRDFAPGRGEEIEETLLRLD